MKNRYGATQNTFFARTWGSIRVCVMIEALISDLALPNCKFAALALLSAIFQDAVAQFAEIAIQEMFAPEKG